MATHLGDSPSFTSAFRRDFDVGLVTALRDPEWYTHGWNPDTKQRVLSGSVFISVYDPSETIRDALWPLASGTTLEAELWEESVSITVAVHNDRDVTFDEWTKAEKGW